MQKNDDVAKGKVLTRLEFCTCSRIMLPSGMGSNTTESESSNAPPPTVDGIESISSSNADADALHCGRDIYRKFRRAGKSGSRSH